MLSRMKNEVLLLKNDGGEDTVVIVETPAWYAWLASARAFSFESPYGSFTARKEHYQRGGWYWKAYRKQSGKLYRTYLGKSEHLTLAYLYKAAAILASKHHPTEASRKALEDAEHRWRQPQKKSSPYNEPQTQIEQHSSWGNELLMTKLTFPVLPERIVERFELVQRIQAGLLGKLTLLCAPAGFGKTTALCAWRRSVSDRDLPVAWVSLDVDDCDPVRFWSYVVAALDRICPGIGAQCNVLLNTTRPHIKAVLILLINMLHTLPSDVVLMLDDYHVIDNIAVHEAMDFLLDHLPSHLHLLLACRSEPPLSLTRLIAAGQLSEIHANNLRFTSEEVASFLYEVMHLHLAQEEITRLAKRTEGWIAGLQLLALAQRGSLSVAESLEDVRSDAVYIVEYLIHEVLSQQTEAIQDFLLQTCVLDRLSPSLCDAVREQENSEMLLKHLLQAKLFLIALDEGQQWYRYHHLFVEALRTHLRQAHPERFLRLHRRASEWYEQQRYMSEAINYALAATDFERAAWLIERAAEDMIGEGRLVTIECWLDALPPHVRRTRPCLFLLRAIPLLLSNNTEAIEECILGAEEALGQQLVSSEQATVRGKIAALRGCIADIHGDAEQTITFSLEALQAVPEQDALWRWIAEINLGDAYYLKGDLAKSSQAYTQAIKLGQQAKNLHIVLFAINNQAEVLVAYGQLRQAVATYQQAFHVTERFGIASQTPLMGYALIGLGKLYYEWNDMEVAEAYLTKGIECGEQSENVKMLRDGYLALACVRLAQGHVEDVTQLLRRAYQVIAPLQNPYFLAIVAAYQAHCWLLQGNLDAASRWAREAGQLNDDLRLPLSDFLQITRVRVLIAERKCIEVLEILTRLQSAAEVLQRCYVIVEVLVLRVVVLYLQGDSVEALLSLAHVLELAEPEAYMRTFLDGGEAIEKMLNHLLKPRQKWVFSLYKVSSVYVKRLYSLYASHKLSTGHVPCILSQRELEVLCLMTDGLADKAIGQKLVLTEGTVKTYARRIYAKLNVSNRTQAIARARALHLL